MEKIKKAKFKEIVKKVVVVILGGMVGLVSGLLGGGGGTLVVPTYQSLLGMEAKKAHATAIATILPLCIVSSIIYLLRGGYDYTQMGVISGGVVIGGLIGSVLLKKLSNTKISLVFYIIMLYAGIKTVI